MPWADAGSAPGQPAAGCVPRRYGDLPWFGTVAGWQGAIGANSPFEDAIVYFITRVVNAETRLYFMQFIRDPDGVWRLDDK